jgi:hypothetical protein
MGMSFAKACAATRIVRGFSVATVLAAAIVFATSLVSAHQARAQNLVQDPGFESTLNNGQGGSTNSPGWTLGTGGGTAFNTSPANPNDPGPHSGNWYAEFQSTSAAQADTSTLSQTITTVVNKNYVVTFFLANVGGPHDSFLATFGGQTVLSLTDSEAFGYTRFTATIKATSTRTVLSFTGEQDPSVFGLDDISVVAEAPAPVTGGGIGSIAVVIAGLSLHRMRRRKA